MMNSKAVLTLFLAAATLVPSAVANSSNLHMNEVGMKSLHLDQRLHLEYAKKTADNEPEREDRQRQQHLDHLEKNQEERHFDFVSRHPLIDLPHHEKLALDSEGNAHGFDVMDTKESDSTTEKQGHIVLDSEAKRHGHVHYDVFVAEQRQESPRLKYEAMDSQPLQQEQHPTPLKNRLYGLQQRLKTRHYGAEQKPLKKRQYGHLQLLKSRQYGEGQVNRNDSSRNDDNSNSNSNSNNNKTYTKDWKESYTMFVIWTMDNLFWLVPFLAHSPLLVIPFFLTYQIVVGMTCLYATELAHGMAFVDAYTQTIVCGAVSAYLCWCLVLYYWMRYQQKKTLGLLGSSGRLVGKSNKKTNMTKGREESDLEAPLLEKPKAPATKDISLYQYYSSINIKPTVWLTIALTLLAAADDLSFVPVIIEKHRLSTMQIQMGAMFAASVISGVALVASQQYERTLIRVPMFVVLFVFANCVTGHSFWDYMISPADTLTKPALVEAIFSFFSNN